MLIQAGILQQLESDDAGSAIAIHLADDQSDASDLRSWHFDVYADQGAGLFFVGDITSRTPIAPAPGAAPPLRPEPRTRIIAICTCPGALKWVVRVNYAAELSSPRPKCEVMLIGSPGMSTPGVVPINERYRTASGAGPGVLQLARGQRVDSWAVFSTAVGGTVDVNGDGPTQIPPAGAVRGDPRGTLDGGPFVFAGAIGGWLVEWRES